MQGVTVLQAVAVAADLQVEVQPQDPEGVAVAEEDPVVAEEDSFLFTYHKQKDLAIKARSSVLIPPLARHIDS